MKRCNEQLKDLKVKKKKSEALLYSYMTRNHIEEYKGYKRDKLAPKPKKKTKTQKQKKIAVIGVLTQMGISDPETAWEAIREAQRPEENNE